MSGNPQYIFALFLNFTQVGSLKGLILLDEAAIKQTRRLFLSEKSQLIENEVVDANFVFT